MTPTEKLVAEARELDRMATQGPWYAEKKGVTVHGFDLEYRICVVDGGKPVYANPIGGSRPAADREFIIRSRILLPALCESLEAAQNAQRWIPVAEGLPTKEDADSGGDVLAWYKSEYNLYRKAGGYALQIKYDDTDFVTHAAALTHWQPLPQPPKGED